MDNDVLADDWKPAQGSGRNEEKREKNKHTQKKGKEALLNIDCSVLGG